MVHKDRILFIASLNYTERIKNVQSSESMSVYIYEITAINLSLLPSTVHHTTRVTAVWRGKQSRVRSPASQIVLCIAEGVILHNYTQKDDECISL